MGRTACTEPQCLYSTAIPLLPLWAVRPVQSLSACKTMHLTLPCKFAIYYIWIHTETRVANIMSVFACNFALRMRQKVKKTAYNYVYLVISFGNILLLRHAFVHVRPLLCLSRSNWATLTQAGNRAGLYFWVPFWSCIYFVSSRRLRLPSCVGYGKDSWHYTTRSSSGLGDWSVPGSVLLSAQH